MSSIFAQASHTLSEKCAVTSGELRGSVAIRDDFQNGTKPIPLAGLLWKVVQLLGMLATKSPMQDRFGK
jgi:hypothetical protein